MNIKKTLAYLALGAASLTAGASVYSSYRGTNASDYVAPPKNKQIEEASEALRERYGHDYRPDYQLTQKDSDGSLIDKISGVEIDAEFYVVAGALFLVIRKPWNDGKRRR